MKKRKPWVAFFLSFVAPGVGQLYNANVRMAFVAFGVSVAFTLFSAFFFSNSFGMLLLGLSLMLVLELIFSIQAYLEAQRLKEIELKPYQRWWVYLGYAVLLFGSPDGYGVLMPSKMQSYQIPSESMVPTLLVGDRLVADGWSYWKKSPERGHIIVFDYPRDEKIKFVKRVVGLPGDIVEIKKGEIYINGQIVSQRRSERPAMTRGGWETVEYLEKMGDIEYPIYRTQPMLSQDFGPITVPADSYFVMGDNRDRSSDSRVWGFVKRSQVLARMNFIFFSWDAEAKRIRTERFGLKVQ